MAKLSIDDLKPMMKDPSLLRDTGFVYAYMNKDFEKKISAYLPVFEHIRQQEGKRMTSVQQLEALPFGQSSFDWQLRRESLRVVQEQVSEKKYALALEVGSWNGWLSKYLTRYTRNLIAAEHFTDPFDGLGAVQYSSEPYTCLHCELALIDCFNTRFDLIVLNHCLHYTADPIAYLQTIKNMLAPGGKIILLGLPFYRNPDKKKEALKNFAAHYASQYQLDIFLGPVKGYLTMEDKELMSRMGFTLSRYRGIWKHKLKTLVRPHLPVFYSAVYSNPANTEAPNL